MSEKLIQRWLKGDDSAAEALYQAHHTRVYRLAYGLLGNRQDAEEVMQDALVYALTHMDRYDPQQAAFSTWLYTITVSRCRDRQRRKRLPQVSLGNRTGDGQDAAVSTPGPEGNALTQERKSELWQALDQLSPKLREAVVLRYWGEHTFQEMGQILGCPLPTAQSRVRLACERLRDLLEPVDVPALEGENSR